MLKSRGPSTDTCGAPLVRSVEVLKVVFIFTLFTKLNLNHFSQNHMYDVFPINES